MAGWISSKLRVAESLLQQIDQQAAESLGKSATDTAASSLSSSLSPSRSPSPSPSSTAVAVAIASPEAIPRKSDSSRPLKYQLPKKPIPPSSSSPSRPDAADPPPPAATTGSVALPPPSSSSSPPSISDGDWTELLSSTPSGGAQKLASVSSGKGVRKGSGSSDARSRKRPGTTTEAGVVVKSPAGDQESPSSSGVSSSRRSSSFLDLTKELLIQEFRAVVDHDQSVSKITSVDANSGKENEEGVLAGDVGKSRISVDRNQDDNAVSISNSRNVSRSNFESGSESDLASDSTSSSDSEEERQRREERRRRMEQLRAERMAAMAAEAIKERENLVARLEGEKLSLEKIFMEREKMQAQEATELQMNMIETIDAVEIEKQKHNSTMMEALASLAELEMKNAELARILATAQRNLEAEVNRVGQLRQQIELKELDQEEHRRKTSKIHQSTLSLSESETLRRSQLEQEILGAEYSLICDKLAKLKDKAKILEENIERTRKEVDYPTEVEIELKKRLNQLTDRLIQKQTQVETLSSEKATLILRIEMVSKLLDESGFSSKTTDFADGFGSAGSLASVDVEAGTWHMPNSSTLRPLIHDRIRTGQQQLGSILRQLDSISSAGVIYLRRNKIAQLWALLYLLCLHLWVFYILMSKSKVPNDARSGAVYSLETINKTAS